MTFKKIIDKALKDNPIFKAFQDAEKIPQTKFIEKLQKDEWQGIGIENANFNAGGPFYGVEDSPIRKYYEVLSH